MVNTVHANGMRGVLITIPATGTILANTFERVSHPYRDRYTWHVLTSGEEVAGRSGRGARSPVRIMVR